MTEGDRHLLPEAYKLLQEVRKSPPARRVNNGGENVIGFFLSWKARQDLQFESLPELFHSIHLEYEPRVLEYCDQPVRIPVVKQRRRKPINFYHVPDWRVLTREGLEFKEVTRLAPIQSDPQVTAAAAQARTWGKPKGLTDQLVTEKDQPDATELEYHRFLVTVRFPPHNPSTLKSHRLETVQPKPGILQIEVANSAPNGEYDYRAVHPSSWRLMFTRERQVGLRQEVIRRGSEKRRRAFAANERRRPWLGPLL